MIDVPLIDLRSQQAQAVLGLTIDDIRAEAWEPCQFVGAAVEVLGYSGLCAPSATSLGHVVALFESRIDPAQVRVVATRDLAEYL